MGTHRRVNLSGGEAAFAFQSLAADVFSDALPDLHRYFVSDLGYIAIPTPGPALMTIVPHLQRRGFLPREHMFPTRLVHRLLMLGSGVTEGFEYILGVLEADVDAERRRSGRAIEPAMLFPVPTYGYFIAAAEKRGIAPVLIRRDLHCGGALRPEDVSAAFERADREGKRVVAFYDCNPHNPLGIIRGPEETAALARVIAEITETYRQRDSAAGRDAPDDREGTWEGPAARVRIIDDLVYEGLEFPGEAPGTSFAEIEEIRDDVILLLGLSKLGLAGLRAGLMVADPDLIRRAYPLQNASSYFPNLPAMRAIERFYRDEEPYRSWRTAHLDALTRTHEYRGKLMHALIDGLDRVPGVSTAERETMVRTVARHTGIDRTAALGRLERGIGRVRVLTRPRAGFFHLLDLSAVRGMRFRLASGEITGPVEEETALEQIEQEAGFHVCFGVWTGLEATDMIQRVSFAVPEDEIIAAVERLEEILSRFEPADASQLSSDAVQRL